MRKKITSFKLSMIAASSLLLFATGCANTTNHRVKQQASPYTDTQMLRDKNLNVNDGTNHTQHGLSNVDNRIDIADKAAAKITNVRGVRHANVLVTKHNAYVAAVLDTKNQLTQPIKDQIANQVRAVDPHIQNVYVSTNPEFTDRISAYVEDVRQGRPVSGFVEQFNEMIQRLFPNAK